MISSRLLLWLFSCGISQLISLKPFIENKKLKDGILSSQLATMTKHNQLQQLHRMRRCSIESRFKFEFNVRFAQQENHSH